MDEDFSDFGEYYYPDFTATVQPSQNPDYIVGDGGILAGLSGDNIFDAEGNYNPPANNDAAPDEWGFVNYNGDLLDTSTGDLYTVGGHFLGNISDTPAAASTSGGSFFGNLLAGLTGGNSTTRSGSPAGASSGGSFGSGFTSGKTSGGSSGPGSGSPSATGQNSSRLSTYPVNAPRITTNPAQNFSVIVPLALVAIVAIYALKKD